MSECKYKRQDGSCAVLSDNEVREYCVEGPCTSFTPIKYIRVDDVIRAFCEDDAIVNHMDSVYDSIDKRIKRAAQRVIACVPAAAVQEVVNCCDCKACKKEDDHEYWCFAWGPAQLVPPDGWCFHGERRTEK